MKTHVLVLSFCFVALATARPGAAQNLLSSGDAVELEGLPSSSLATDDNAYADGVRAINSGRWSDAVAIFSHIVAQGSDHADAALYWEAYAENKQGQSSSALETCGALRRAHAGSSWIEDCGALEIEIHSKNGQPVPPSSEQSDDLKLLALASLMQHDEKKGLQEIDEILNSDASEKLKQGALFIMGQHHTDTVYSQIARLSFVDGDVRIQRGEINPHRKEVTWEEAASGVPLESGYSIVTGDGRAEIELENASVVYLAPNSVLTINDLSTTEGVPHTEMALLSGTVTLHVQPYVSGETFLLHTPTDNITTRFPASSNIRVTSYMDGVALSALEGHLLAVGQNEMTPTVYLKNGHRILEAGPVHHEDFSSWDHWVGDRYAARTAATEAMLKASGLTAPVPGLADMQGQGRFFDCEPYGKCWEPGAADAEHIQTASPQGASSGESGPIAATVVSGSSPGQAAQTTRDIRFIGPPAASGPGSQSAELGSFYPCIPGDVRATLSRGTRYPDPAWAWTVCHTGGWIYQGNRYLWVAGKRHHRSCVHWVKSGRTVAFVPIHPRDVRDRLPVNRKAPAFAVGPKNERTLQRIALNTPHTVELMKEPPREFRNEAPTPLPHVAEPHMEGHQIHDSLIAKGMTPHAGIPITFNHHSQSFMMPSHVMEGNQIGSGLTPITNHGGDLQAHSGVTSGGGFHGGYGGGGFHGGASGGSGHSGGASSGGGGGSHGGGGGASSAGASSGGGGGGGSHH
jgi:hypothetical protein